jgi:hypothetical protein
MLQAPDKGAITQAPPARQLRIVILECERAVNDVRAATACEPRVRVEDENGNAVAGASVSFTLPKTGPSGYFPQRMTTLVVQTGSNGEAAAQGFVPNRLDGPFEIRVEASFEGNTAVQLIHQINALTITPAVEKRSQGRGKLLAILGGVAAAAVAGVAMRGGGGGGAPPASAPAPGTTVTPGKPTVGPP